MANQWVTQWVKIGEAQLSALQQLSELNFPPAAASQGNGFDLADGARLVKAQLAAWQKIGALGNDLGTRLFLQNMQLLNGAVSNGVRQSLVQLLESFSGQWSQQQGKLKNGIQESIDRCLSNLELAQTRDDITMVLGAFGNELNQKAKDAGGDAFGLLNSAHAAANVWLQQTLDQLIAAKATEATAE